MGSPLDIHHLAPAGTLGAGLRRALGGTATAHVPWRDASIDIRLTVEDGALSALPVGQPPVCLVMEGWRYPVAFDGAGGLEWLAGVLQLRGELHRACLNDSCLQLLAAAWGIGVRHLAMLPEASAPAARGQLVLTCTVRGTDLAFRIGVSVSDGGAADALARCLSEAPLRREARTASATPLTCLISLGHAPLPLTELRALDIGDAVLLPHAREGCVRVLAGEQDSFVGWGTVPAQDHPWPSRPGPSPSSPSHPSQRSDWKPDMPDHDDPPSSSAGGSHDGSHAPRTGLESLSKVPGAGNEPAMRPVPIDDIRLPVEFVFGKADITVAELSALSQGQELPMAVKSDDRAVQIRVAGVTVGEGRVVRLGDGLAVEVMAIRGGHVGPIS